MVQPALEGLAEVNQAKGRGWLSREKEGKGVAVQGEGRTSEKIFSKMK